MRPNCRIGETAKIPFLFISALPFPFTDPGSVLATVHPLPIVLIVLRTMLGFTPPEWAYATEQRANIAIPRGAVCSLDRRIRINPLTPLLLALHRDVAS
jgi:hypothetical protein